VRQYTGNWSDWAAKRREEEAPVKVEKPKAAPGERPKNSKLRFSYKEEREFASIDGEIAELEQKIAECEAEQSRCGSDYIKLQELQAKQSELEEQLEAKMERWMYLNELKEKIDAQ
jgi:ATP-binding cassette subfamily F protein uup